MKGLELLLCVCIMSTLERVASSLADIVMIPLPLRAVTVARVLSEKYYTMHVLTKYFTSLHSYCIDRYVKKAKTYLEIKIALA